MKHKVKKGKAFIDQRPIEKGSVEGTIRFRKNRLGNLDAQIAKLQAMREKIASKLATDESVLEAIENEGDFSE